MHETLLDARNKTTLNQLTLGLLDSAGASLFSKTCAWKKYVHMPLINSKRTDPLAASVALPLKKTANK